MAHSIYVYALLTFNLICSIEAMKEFVGDSMGDAYGVEVEDKGEKLTVSLGEDESGHHEEIQAGAHNRDIALVEVTASGALTMAEEKPKPHVYKGLTDNQCFSCVSQGNVYCKTTRDEKCYEKSSTPGGPTAQQQAAAHGCGGMRITPPLQYVMVSQGTVSASQPLDLILAAGSRSNPKAFNNPAEGIKFNFAACGVVKGAPPDTTFVDCSKITDKCRKDECDRFCSAKNKAAVQCESPRLGGAAWGNSFYCGEFPPEVKAEMAKNNNTETAAMTCKTCLDTLVRGQALYAFCDGPPVGQAEHTGIKGHDGKETACYSGRGAIKGKCAKTDIVVAQNRAKHAGCS